MCAKNDVINTNNLHIVTQQGTKIGSDNPRISKIKEKNFYPDPVEEKQIYKDAKIYLENLPDRKKQTTIDITQ